ncbi:MAG TPA: ribonuclease HII [Patescibacteria group bacterium]|nr:ribonuclease HII [Patescibacteria group bacterium]
MLINLESKHWKRGIRYIAGVDEVGRGCLAGPMVVSAVVLDTKHLNDCLIYNDVDSETYRAYNQIKDSKLLAPKKRFTLASFIKKHAISYHIEVIKHTKLDEWGISKSTQIGFYNAVKGLEPFPEHIFTDNFRINAINENIQTNIPKGDTLSITVAAASIIAKVYRDELMVRLHNNSETYKIYGFDKNKGYGTKYHLSALYKYGASDIHRKSFAPIKYLD